MKEVEIQKSEVKEIISCWRTEKLPRGGAFELSFEGWKGFGNTNAGIPKQIRHTELKLWGRVSG